MPSQTKQPMVRVSGNERVNASDWHALKRRQQLNNQQRTYRQPVAERGEGESR